MMDEVLRSQCKAYCQLDEELTPADERLFDQIILGCMSYLEGAGIVRPKDESNLLPQWLLVFEGLVLDCWDHRSATAVDKVADNPVHRRMLSQLKLSM